MEEGELEWEEASSSLAFFFLGRVFFLLLATSVQVAFGSGVEAAAGAGAVLPGGSEEEDGSA